MSIKYTCEYCNYATDNNGCYKRHINSKKHLLKLPNIKEEMLAIRDSGAFKCVYCGKLLRDKKSKSRHYKNCNSKKLTEKFAEEKTKFEEENSKLKQELLELERDHIDFVKMVCKNGGIANGVINNNNTSNNSTNNVNMYYVINNFHNPYNIEDLMRPKLSQDEKEYILKNGALAGSLKLIKDRCITNIKVEKRPFHCVDDARNKYIVRENDDWVIDKNGNKILTTTYSKIEEAYPDIPSRRNINLNDIDSDDPDIMDFDGVDMEKYTTDMTQLMDMRNNGNRIIGEINKFSLLKNNVK